MVNKTNRSLAAINCDTAYNIGRIFPLGNILKSVSVNDCKIFNLKAIDSVD